MKIEDLRIAAILDEFSEYNLRQECKLINLGVYRWKEQIESFHPNLLLVESAWRGHNNEWFKRVVPLDQELKALVEWCKSQRIPTVFWNKEDPVHFTTFFQTVKLFDWVFTTDLESIPLYKLLLQHKQVGLFPFAASLKVFNPIEQYERKDAVSFAGSYYRFRIERSRDFDNIYRSCTRFLPFEIYDRKSHPQDINYTYPEWYGPSLQGTLPISKIDTAYKQYRYSVTINTVQDSSTMEARRIFELMASNTITISNECRAVRLLFGDLALIHQKDGQIPGFEQVLRDSGRYQKQRLSALRKILTEHTYRLRLEHLISKVLYQKVEQPVRRVLIYSFVESVQQAERIFALYQKQTYGQKELVLIVENTKLIQEINQNISVRTLQKDAVTNVSSIGNAEYYAYWSVQNYYGSNYILDCMLALEYSNADAIGKGSYYRNQDHMYQMIQPGQCYRLVNSLYLDRSIVSKRSAETIQLQQLLTNQPFQNQNMLSIDPYNFCENESAQSCETVDDLVMNIGVSMERIYQIAESLDENRIQAGVKLTGSDLYRIFSPTTVPMNITVDGTMLRIKPLVQNAAQVYATLTKRFDVAQYQQNGLIPLAYLCNTKNGSVALIIFMNESMQIIKTVAIAENTMQQIPIPPQARWFHFRLILKANQETVIHGIYIKPESSRIQI